MSALEGTKASKDVTTDTKFNKENNLGTLTLKESEVGKFDLTVTVDGNVLHSQVTLTD